MNRVAFQIGDFSIYWYGIMFALAFLFGVLLYQKNCRRCGIHPDEGLDIILWSVLGGIVGARLYYVAFEWDSYKNDIVKILNLREGGVAIYGAVIGALIVGCFVCRKKRLPALAVCDAAFPGLLLAQSVGRWGNFFNMEAFGCNTDLPWGMTSRTISRFLADRQAELFAEGMMIYPDRPVHPTFLYESLWDILGVCLLMFVVMRNRKYDGEVTFSYAGWYGFGRFFIEGLRTDSLYWGPVRVSQALGGLLFLLSSVLVFYFLARARRPVTLEYAEGQKPPRILMRRYADTEESRERIRLADAKSAAGRAKRKKDGEGTGEMTPGKPEDEKEEQNAGADD